MGRGDEPMNNWTAWCTQNVLIAVMTSVSDSAVRHKVIAKAAGSLDFFLEHGDDGCCGRPSTIATPASASTTLRRDPRHRERGGVRVRLGRGKIRNIADYIVNMHVAGRTYFNFADCSAKVPACSSREFLFGRRVGGDRLMAFAAADWAPAGADGDDIDGINLYYMTQDAFATAEIAAYRPAAPVAPREIYYPSVGVFVARDGHFALAVKAGDNGDSHNHNDTGSVTLYKDGAPVLIDVGVESYTKDLFARALHDLDHAVGVAQSSDVRRRHAGRGRSLRPRRVDRVRAGGELDRAGHRRRLSAKQSRTYRRRVRLLKGQAVELVDTWDGDNPAELTLMFRDRPEIDGARLVLPGIAELAWTGAGPALLEGGADIGLAPALGVADTLYPRAAAAAGAPRFTLTIV